MVAGNTNNNFVIGPIKSTLFVILLFFMNTLGRIALMLDSIGFVRLATLFAFASDVFGSVWDPVRLIPAEIGGLVTFGSYWYEWEVGPHYSPSDGWAYALGLRGAQSINGSFYGSIRAGLIGLFHGLTGFTGIVLRPWHTGRLLFLGSALRAGLSHIPPY